MTESNFRALCAELVGAVENYDFDSDNLEQDWSVLERARTALAQPEPEGVTDAASRVAHYLEQRRLIRGLDPEEIHALHAGTDEPRQGTLTASDLEALTRYARPTIESVPVSERLPEPGKKVLAYYLNALGKRRTIIAEWVPATWREDSPAGESDDGEYDEETDKFYWPEGWYEQIENWADFAAIAVREGEITHWQPLPPGPYHALPVPGAEVE